MDILYQVATCTCTGQREEVLNGGVGYVVLSQQGVYVTLPRKRKRARSGIMRAPRRAYPAHRKFVRGHDCVVEGCPDGPIEFAHVRLGAKDNGKGIKPHDCYGVSLCHAHHAESHSHGEATFQRKYAIDLIAVALEFAAKSPVVEVREYAKMVRSMK
jgi:hypothetical protein